MLIVPSSRAQRAQEQQQRQPVTWLNPDGKQHDLVDEGELVTALRVILDQPDVRVFALAVQRDTELVSFVLRHDRMPDLHVSATDNS